MPLSTAWIYRLLLVSIGNSLVASQELHFLGVTYNRTSGRQVLLSIDPDTVSVSSTTEFDFDSGGWSTHLAGVANSGRAYARSSAGTLYEFHIDSLTGSAQAVGSAYFGDVRISALDFDIHIILMGSADTGFGDLVGVGYNKTSGQHGIVSMRSSTGNVTRITEFFFNGGGWAPSTFAVNQSDGVAYAISKNGTLYRFAVNGANAWEVFTLGDFGSSAPIFMSMDIGPDGMLLAVGRVSDRNTNVFMAINPSGPTIINTIDFAYATNIWSTDTFCADQLTGIAYSATTIKEGTEAELYKFEATIGGGGTSAALSVTSLGDLIVQLTTALKTSVQAMTVTYVTPPTVAPTANPTAGPTSSVPTRAPTTPGPSVSPTISPTISHPSQSPTFSPTLSNPTSAPTSSRPTFAPTSSPSTSLPTQSPTTSPSKSPTSSLPTSSPTTSLPTVSPTMSPSLSPTSSNPTLSPTISPTISPSSSVPTSSPASSIPTESPTTSFPTSGPTLSPTASPTISSPTATPLSSSPTIPPSTSVPSSSPTYTPTISPTRSFPTQSPTMSPTVSPSSSSPTDSPSTSVPTNSPTVAPTLSPTTSPPTTAPTSSSPTASPSTSVPTTSVPTDAPIIFIEESTNEDSNTPVVIGAALGVIVFLILAGGCIFVVVARKRNRHARTAAIDGQHDIGAEVVTLTRRTESVASPDSPSPSPTPSGDSESAPAPIGDFLEEDVPDAGTIISSDDGNFNSNDSDYIEPFSSGSGEYLSPSVMESHLGSDSTADIASPPKLNPRTSDMVLYNIPEDMLDNDADNSFTKFEPKTFIADDRERTVRQVSVRRANPLYGRVASQLSESSPDDYNTEEVVKEWNSHLSAPPTTVPDLGTPTPVLPATTGVQEEPLSSLPAPNLDDTPPPPAASPPLLPDEV